MKLNTTTYIYSLISLLLMSFFSSKLSGQELVRPVITGAPFLQVVPDARSGGMGEVGVSSLSDNFSQFHNPAKFLFMGSESSGVGLSYIPQFVGYAKDIFHGQAGYYQQLNERSALSGSLTYFSFGNLELEEERGGQIINTGSFVPNELALEAAYSLKLNEFFGMAITSRYIRSDITDSQMNSILQLKTGQAVAADVSGYYISNPFTHANKWTAGFALKNVGSKLEYSNESGYEYPLPTSLKLGGGYHIANGKSDYISFYAEALKLLVPATDENRMLPDDSAIGGIFRSFGDAPDGFSEEMKEIIWSVGSEISLNEILELRTGYITQSRAKGFRNHITVGAGLIWEGFIFDFAYQSPISKNITFNNDKVMKLSLSYRFGQNQSRSKLEPSGQEVVSSGKAK